MGGENRYIYGYGWDSLLLTWNYHKIVLIGYTPMQNKKFKKKKSSLGKPASQDLELIRSCSPSRWRKGVIIPLGKEP